MSEKDFSYSTGDAEQYSAHLAAIVEFSEDAVISKNLDGIVLSWNSSAERIFGYTADEIIGQPITLIIPPHLFPEENTILENIRQGTRINHYETVRRHKNGNDIVVSLSASPVRNLQGTIIGASKIVRDISQAKEIEAELRESQVMLELTMRSGHIGAWSREISSGKMWWNDELKEIFGYPQDTFSQTDDEFFRLIHEDDRENIWNQINSAISGKREYQVQFRFRHADGSYRWMEARGQAVYSDKGEPVRTYGIGIDITERKTAENKAVQAYLELLSRIVKLAQIFGTSKDLISIYRAFREFVSQSMPCTAFIVSFYDEENSLRIAEYVWSEDSEIDTEIFPPLLISENGGANSKAVLQKKTVVVGKSYTDTVRERQHLILDTDGINPHSALIVPMILNDRVIGTIEVQAYEENAFNPEHIAALEMVATLAAVAIENVRLLKTAEKARSEAENANRSKDEFLSVVSHELRSPLNAVLGWTQILKRQIPGDEKNSRAVEIIEKNAHLQNSLIEDLLDVSRIISGKMRIEKRPLNFAGVVSSVVETARPSAEEKNISLIFENPNAFCPILGDEVRLQQIVANLINNAVKFTPESGKIRLNLSQISEQIRLEISDTGIGIKSELLPHIFEKFSQADSTTKRNFSGLGLGLTIVKNLTELHGGKVKAESSGINKGAKFILEFPVAEGIDTDDLMDENSIPPENPFLNARILMVDDDLESLLPLAILLEHEQAEVICVGSGSEALELLAKENFDLLISDIGMPDIDGYDLIKKIRGAKDSPNFEIPAVALTAYVTSQDINHALESGFWEHFGKPINFDNFISAITTIIRKSHSNDRRKK